MRFFNKIGLWFILISLAMGHGSGARGLIVFVTGSVLFICPIDSLFTGKLNKGGK